MIKIGTFSYLELKEILGASNKQAVDRRLKRYGVSFTSSGRGNNRVYEITEIENPFKLYCITELKISAQSNFDKIRNLFYYFFCVDGFTELPLVEMEKTMRAEGSQMSRQFISRWITYLRHLDYITFSDCVCNYYAISKNKKGERNCRQITHEEYKAALAIYFDNRDKKGCHYAYVLMYQSIGGHPYKKPIYYENALMQTEIKQLIDMIMDTLPTTE